jgi:hypothetical protein
VGTPVGARIHLSQTNPRLATFRWSTPRYFRADPRIRHADRWASSALPDPMRENDVAARRWPIDFAICTGRHNILTVADLGSQQP